MRDLRTTFDEVAERYDAARPRYPRQLLDDLQELAALGPGSRVLEVGPGTGIATIEFAKRGWSVDGVELGENMARVGQRAVASYPRVHIRVGAFEQVELDWGSYDLVTAATAWHWVDESVGYARAAAALAPGGALAPFRYAHVRSEADGGVFDMLQEAYEEHAPHMTQPLRTLEELPEWERLGMERSGLFGPVTVRRYVWDEPYTASRYLEVLDTYSDHRALPLPQRQRLFEAIAERLARRGGQIVKGYGALLSVARRSAEGTA